MIKKLKNFLTVKKVKRILLIILLTINFKTKTLNTKANNFCVNKVVEERLFSNQDDRHVILVKRDSSPNNFSKVPPTNNPVRGNSPAPSGLSGPSGPTQTNFIDSRQVPRTLPPKNPAANGQFKALDAKKPRNSQGFRSSGSNPGGSNPGGSNPDESNPGANKNDINYKNQNQDSFTNSPNWVKSENQKRGEQCELDENVQNKNVVIRIDPRSGLERESRIIKKDNEVRRAIEGILERLEKAGPNCFNGLKPLKGPAFKTKKVYEITHPSGGRVYFLKQNNKVQVIGFSIKKNQKKVIDMIIINIKNNVYD